MICKSDFGDVIEGGCANDFIGMLAAVTKGLKKYTSKHSLSHLILLIRYANPPV